MHVLPLVQQHHGAEVADPLVSEARRRRELHTLQLAEMGRVSAAGGVTSGHAKSGHVRSLHVTSGHDRSLNVTSGHCRSHQVTTGHIRSLQVTGHSLTVDLTEEVTVSKIGYSVNAQSTTGDACGRKNTMTMRYP